MPNPSSVSAQQINTELGVSSTTILPLSNNWVKNLASTFSTANTNVKMGDCRWGINFPGGSMLNYRSGIEDYSKNYDQDNRLYIGSFDQVPVYDFSTATQASCWVTLYSNGVMKIEANDSGDVGTPQHFTWLTSGTNADYTGNFTVDSGFEGALDAGSSANNSDLALSTTRQWYVVTSLLQGSGGDQDDVKVVQGNLIIKSSGTTLITRPVTLYAQATLGQIV
jgi:hypothetical protein